MSKQESYWFQKKQSLLCLCLVQKVAPLFFLLRCCSNWEARLASEVDNVYRYGYEHRSSGGSKGTCPQVAGPIFST